MKFVKPVLLAVCLALPLTACSSHDNMDHGTHVEVDGLILKDVVVRPPLPGRDTAAGYFTLINKGQATKLLSASSSISDRVEIHTHTSENGVMKMRRVEGVELASGESVEFKPGSYHLMMFNVKPEADLSEVPVTLTFENGKVITVSAFPEGESSDDDSDDHSGH